MATAAPGSVTWLLSTPSGDIPCSPLRPHIGPGAVHLTTTRRPIAVTRPQGPACLQPPTSSGYIWPARHGSRESQTLDPRRWESGDAPGAEALQTERYPRGWGSGDTQGLSQEIPQRLSQEMEVPGRSETPGGREERMAREMELNEGY